MQKPDGNICPCSTINTWKPLGVCLFSLYLNVRGNDYDNNNKAQLQQKKVKRKSQHHPVGCLCSSFVFSPPCVMLHKIQ